jgi:hypothetical protein
MKEVWKRRETIEKKRGGEQKKIYYFNLFWNCNFFFFRQFFCFIIGTDRMF